MITCPNCNTQNIDGSAFCEECGFSLANASQSAAPAAAQSAAVQPQAGLTCPKASCQHPNPIGAQFCEQCGEALAAPQPAAEVVIDLTKGAGQAAPEPDLAQPVAPQLVQPQPVVAQPVTGRPRFVVQATGTEIDLIGAAQAIVGRSDPPSGWSAPIDLAPHGGGPEQGVSRKHMAVTEQAGQVTVVDLESLNGTFVNEERLAPNAPRVLVDGDQVRLGKASLVFRNA